MRENVLSCPELNSQRKLKQSGQLSKYSARFSVICVRKNREG